MIARARSSLRRRGKRREVLLVQCSGVRATQTVILGAIGSQKCIATALCQCFCAFPSS